MLDKEGAEPERPADTSTPTPPQREAMLRLLVESVTDYAIFALDAQGRVATWNPGAQRLKGYTSAEIVGQHFSRFYPPDKPRAVIDQELVTASTTGRFREEGWRVRKDGSRFWADVTITPIRDASGSVVGYAKVTRDMTARKEADEQKLQLAQAEAARAAAEDASRRLASLVEVSRALAEARLEFGVVADVVTRKIGEIVGETCVMRIARGDDLVPVAVHSANPEALRLLRESLAAAPLDRGSVVHEAFRTGQSILQNGPAVAAATSALQPSYRPFLDQFPPWSILAVPMVMPGGEVVGVISLARSRVHEPYSEDDRLFVESLAFRTALALSNARLYREAQEAHEQLRLIFRGIAEGILVQDRTGRIILANDVGAQMCGFATAEELMATPIGAVLDRFELLDEDGKPFPLENLPARRALKGEDHAEAMLRSRARGGEGERWSITRATPLRGTDGEVLYAISIFEDITERRRVFERLRFLSEAGDLLGSSLEYEQTLARLAALAVPRIADWCTVHVFDEHSRPRQLAVAHVDPAKVKWAMALNERHPVDLQESTGVGAVLRTGKAEMVPLITDDMIRAGTEDEGRLAIIRELGLRSYICVPLVARERIVGALSLLTTEESGRVYGEQDLTLAELLGRRAGLAVENARLYSETQAALTQVTEVSRLKDEFLATLSHELRTPLNAIVGWAQMLMGGALDGERARKAIETISRNANLQSRLIADILDMSRIITGKVRLTLVSTNPDKVIEQAIDVVRPTADAKGITIEAILDHGAGPVTADPERLQQVLWNLLSNAIKFVPRGGRVQVRLATLNSHVEIVVADNGPGIEPDFLPHVFERFRQADASSTRSHGGLGLGLAIVKHLVELHGGQIKAGNREDRRGAVFTVSLPRRALVRSDVVAAGAPVTAATAELPLDRTLAGIRVMVVDDEEDARDILAAALEESGADVVPLASADAALESLPAVRPHVLLSDIEMPAKDGYALMEAVRALPPAQGGLTPAIAITAYARVEDRVRALGAGFDLHIAKPIQLEELRAAVSRLAGHRRQTTE
jgi:PAS domain S-box-containing protein